MSPYIHHQLSVLKPYVPKDSKVLDFGCGDMVLDTAIVHEFPTIQCIGIDVVDSKPVLAKQMKFLVYDGVTIPFPKKSFDVVFAFHVMHHCEDPRRALSECKRVTKKRILIVESVLRSVLEIPGFMVVDFLVNVGRKFHIPMPFHVHTKEWWKETFDMLHLRVVETIPVGVLPSWLPIGKTTLFVLEEY